MHSPFVDIQKVFQNQQKEDDSKTVSYNLTQDKKKVTKPSPVNKFKHLESISTSNKQDIEPAASLHNVSLSE